MKTLTFAAPIVFSVQQVIRHRDVYHIYGYLMTGKFQSPRHLRVAPDSRWDTLLYQRIVLPGLQLKEIAVEGSAARKRGRWYNGGHKTPSRYLSPLDKGMFHFDEVKLMDIPEEA